jgi:hypothetical protein
MSLSFWVRHRHKPDQISVQRKSRTVLIYLAAAAATSGFVLNPDAREEWRGFLVEWLIVCAIPLLFAFTYSRHLLSNSPVQQKRQRFGAVLSGLAIMAAALLVPLVAPVFRENPMGDSVLALQLVPLIALPVFLVAALFLLLKGRSSFATFACALFWPYWFVIALDLYRWPQDGPMQTVLYFLCLISPTLFAFAAGAASYRPTLAHATALSALVGMSWVYWSLRASPLRDAWVMFNVPDASMGLYPELQFKLTILAVPLIALATATAALRLLPSHWQFRKLSLCERTWPALAVGLLVLAIWFGQSVMPYRLPGGVNLGEYTTLKILHVEKRGLQFHETCVSVELKDYGAYVIVSGNDRRLFQYRFPQKAASARLSGSLIERVRAIAHPWKGATEIQESIRPIRAWNADNWYFGARGVRLEAYTMDNGSMPPQEIVNLFHDLEALPRSAETRRQVKDICLGFCYGPQSEVGVFIPHYSDERY